MANILKPKVQASGLVDSFEMAILKTVSERLATPVIGNGTLVSGAVKLAAGGIIPSISRNKHAGLLSSAMIIDGVEDAAHVIVGSVMGGTRSSGEW